MEHQKRRNSAAVQNAIALLSVELWHVWDCGSALPLSHGRSLLQCEVQKSAREIASAGALSSS
jgi:hypothetical protein